MIKRLKLLTTKHIIDHLDDADDIEMVFRSARKRHRWVNNDLDAQELARWTVEKRALSEDILVTTENSSWEYKPGRITDTVYVYNKETGNTFALNPFINSRVIHIVNTWKLRPCVFKDTRDDKEFIREMKDAMEISENDAEHLFYLFFSRISL